MVAVGQQRLAASGPFGKGDCGARVGVAGVVFRKRGSEPQIVVLARSDFVLRHLDAPPFADAQPGLLGVSKRLSVIDAPKAGGRNLSHRGVELSKSASEAGHFHPETLPQKGGNFNENRGAR